MTKARSATIPHGATLWRECIHDQAAQIVEFAVSLPLLMVFVVGIFDFSGALTLKQKLTNAAREGARAAAAGPANDLSSTSGIVPESVSTAFLVVDNYLLSENINDCGLSTVTAPPQAALTWTYTSTGSGCPGSGITLTINRGSVVKNQPLGRNSTDVVNTQVQIQYAYKWRFNSVITVVVPKATYAGVTSITTTATAFNEN